MRRFNSPQSAWESNRCCLSIITCSMWFSSLCRWKRSLTEVKVTSVIMHSEEVYMLHTTIHHLSVVLTAGERQIRARSRPLSLSLSLSLCRRTAKLLHNIFFNKLSFRRCPVWVTPTFGGGNATTRAAPVQTEPTRALRWECAIDLPSGWE